MFSWIDKCFSEIGKIMFPGGNNPHVLTEEQRKTSEKEKSENSIKSLQAKKSEFTRMISNNSREINRLMKSNEQLEPQIDIYNRGKTAAASNEFENNLENIKQLEYENTMFSNTIRDLNVRLNNLKTAHVYSIIVENDDLKEETKISESMDPDKLVANTEEHAKINKNVSMIKKTSRDIYKDRRDTDETYRTDDLMFIELQRLRAIREARGKRDHLFIDESKNETKTVDRYNHDIIDESTDHKKKTSKKKKVLLQ